MKLFSLIFILFLTLFIPGCNKQTSIDAIESSYVKLSYRSNPFSNVYPTVTVPNEFLLVENVVVESNVSYSCDFSINWINSEIDEDINDYIFVTDIISCTVVDGIYQGQFQIYLLQYFDNQINLDVSLISDNTIKDSLLIDCNERLVSQSIESINVYCGDEEQTLESNYGFIDFNSLSTIKDHIYDDSFIINNINSTINKVGSINIESNTSYFIKLSDAVYKLLKDEYDCSTLTSNILVNNNKSFKAILKELTGVSDDNYNDLLNQLSSYSHILDLIIETTGIDCLSDSICIYELINFNITDELPKVNLNITLTGDSDSQSYTINDRSYFSDGTYEVTDGTIICQSGTCVGGECELIINGSSTFDNPYYVDAGDTLNIEVYTGTAGGTSGIFIPSISVYYAPVCIRINDPKKTYVLSGKYKAIDLVVTDGDFNQQLNFTCNGVTYSSINVEPESTNGFIIPTIVRYDDTIVNGSNILEPIYNEYKLIDLGSTPQEVSEEFYNWFIMNYVTYLEPTIPIDSLVGWKWTYNGSTDWSNFYDGMYSVDCVFDVTISGNVESCTGLTFDESGNMEIIFNSHSAGYDYYIISNYVANSSWDTMSLTFNSDGDWSYGVYDICAEPASTIYAIKELSKIGTWEYVGVTPPPN